MDFGLREQVLDNLPDGITIQDRGFNIIYQNKAIQAAFGEHIGQKCYAIYERRDEICEGCGVLKVFQTGASNIVLRTAFEADGKTSYWENSCFPLLDSEGTIIAGVEVCRNTTDRVSLEEEVKDRNIDLGQLNRELKQKTAQLTSALAERETAELKLRREIEDRKHAEEALRESEDRYRTQFEELLDAMFVADARTGIIIDCNQAAAALVGRKRSELVGQHQRILHPPDPKGGEYSETFAQHRTCKAAQALETKVITKSGEVKDVSVTASRFTLRGKDVMQGVFHDITDRRLAEAELAQVRKLEAVGQLAAGIAHEINTPTQFVGDNIAFLKDALDDLLGLQGKQDLLLQEAKAGKVSDETIAAVEAAAEAAEISYLLEEVPNAIEGSLDGVARISKIVLAMKEFSHPGAANMAFCDINRAIETTITVARNEWKYVAEMEMDLDPNLPLLPCLIGELNQAILNLVINASHAIADVVERSDNKLGKITIQTTHDDTWAEIRVSDTGGGIPREIRSRIFEPFFTTKDVGKGSGQGLAVTHSVIVKKHGGMLTFETEEGRGTTFVIKLPLCAAEAA